MQAFIIGGAASGKSAHAEALCCRLKGQQRLYLATMDAGGASAQARIQKHRAMRAGKGFHTLECPRGLAQLELQTRYDTILLEDVGNLLANTLFAEASSASMTDAAVVADILDGIAHLRAHCTDLVIVGNLVFSDGLRYDASTRRYIALMGELNQRIARDSDVVAESVCGILQTMKGDALWAG